MANADGFCRAGKLGGRQPIDPVIGFLGDPRAGMGDAGEVNHGLDAFKQSAPLDRAGQVGNRNHLDRARKHIRGLAHRRPHRMSRARQLGHQCAADEARRPGDQDASHGLPRAKLRSRPPTNTAAQPTAIVATTGPGHSTVAIANATSATLTTNTRATIAGTLKPRLVAS